MSIFSSVTKSLGLTKPEYPDRDWIYKHLPDKQFTKDYKTLDQKEHHLLFVYNDQEHPPAGEVICGAFTVETYTMLKRKLGKASSPVILEASYPQFGFHEQKDFKFKAGYKIFKGTNSRAIIKGLVLRIPTESFLTLDTMYANGLYSLRKRVKVFVPYHDILNSKERGEFKTDRKVVTTEVWVYIGKPDYWEDQISMLSQVKIYVPNKPIENFRGDTKIIYDKFYFWTPAEYDL